MLKASRHTEMDEEVAATLKLENQILAATAHISDALSLQRGRDDVRRLGPGYTAVEDGDAFEAPSGQSGRESGADRLDLGELRHATSVAAGFRTTRHDSPSA
jgi:hypothetical protein